ncbi:MAG: outer membrane protein assembly factor BamA [Planctomycetes bacterium]|nr:outer membrane protein assembly factor BamA [Planctomycetota bacterium]
MAVLLVCHASLTAVNGAVPGTPLGVDAATDEVTLRGDIVRSIDFHGNAHFKKKVLRQRIGIELGDQMDPFLAEGARRILVDVHKKVGYVFVEVLQNKDLLPSGRLEFTIREGARVRIKAVRFEGNRAYRNDTLSAVVKTKAKKMFVLPSYYTAQRVEEDAEKLREFYYDHGYLGHKVEPNTDFSEDKEWATITFAIDEGKPYRVERVTYSGATHFSEEVLSKNIEVTSGQIYLRELAEKGRRDIEDLYRENGFIDVKVTQTPRFKADAENRTVVVEFVVVEGRQFRIGQIHVSGNEGVQDKVVRRVLDEYGFTPGKLYNAKFAPVQGDSLLEKYVQRSTLAEEVIIQPVPAANGAPDQKDVYVDITEGMTGMIMPGVGVSSSYGFVGQLVYQQQNFDIQDWPESWKEVFFMKAFRGAGQNMRIALEPGTRFSRYSVSFSDPYFRDRPINLNVSGSSYTLSKFLLKSYEEKRLRAAVGFEHRQWGKYRKVFNVRTERVGVQALDFDAPQEIRDVEGDNYITGLKVGTGKTVVDDIYMPHEGYVFRVAYEQVFGEFNFGIATASAVRYYTLYEDVLERKTVLSASVKGGTILGDAPPFEMFYAGGSGGYSIRGFDYRGVSTRGLQVFDNPATAPVPQIKDPIGSDWVFTASGEATIPLLGENFALLAFIDSGVVDTGGWRYSVGTGIQILVPQWFGPVPMRFEFGVPLRKDEKDDVRQFNFTMGRLF